MCTLHVFYTVSSVFDRTASISNTVLQNVTLCCLVGAYRCVILPPDDCHRLGRYIVSPGKYRVYQNEWSGFEFDYIYKYGEQNYKC